MTPNGELTTVTSFDPFTNGHAPYASLLQATNGDFYGTTRFGGVFNLGTVFRLSFSSLAAPVFQSVTRTGPTFLLTFSSVPGRTYQMQFKTDLSQNGWKDLGSTFSATNITMTVSDSIHPDAQRFYRIALVN